MKGNRTSHGISSIEYAYIAGFLDSDGCISIASQNRRARPTLVWHQVRPEGVLFLRERFQGSLFLLERRKNNRRQLGIGFASEVTLQIVKGCLPFLRIKSEQAQIVLEAFKNGLTLEENLGKPVSAALKAIKARRLDKSSFVTGHLLGASPEFWHDPEDHQKRIPTPFEYLCKPTDLDRAYLAGVFDGDGNLEVDNSKVSFRLQQAEVEAVLLFRKIYGGSVHIEDRELPNRKPTAVYRTAAQKTVSTILTDLLPFLTEKRVEAAAILKHWHSAMSNKELATLTKIFTNHRNYEISDEEIETIRKRGLLGYQKPSCKICGEHRIAGEGFCHKHYERFRKYGDPQLLLKQTSCRKYVLARENADGSVQFIDE